MNHDDIHRDIVTAIHQTIGGTRHVLLYHPVKGDIWEDIAVNLKLCTHALADDILWNLEYKNPTKRKGYDQGYSCKKSPLF